ncbi:MAG TPA: GNAT family N-acetyltransferase [Stellaceae bacterium]|jgi:GNAT superfamily N-acetyltransferase|nr:GNAT family N-acetyltransferase [Stellaceae bacterium]
MTPDSLGWAVEEACFNGFPGLRQMMCGGWLVRVSGSTRRTANSATALPGHDGSDEVIAAIEAVYRRHGQPAIFRIPSYIEPDVDRRLAERGYSDEGHSRVIHGDIGSVADAAAPSGVTLSAEPSAAWFAAMRRLQGQDEAAHASYRRVLGSILLPARFAVDEGDAAMAFGVIHRGLLCYESVVTDPARRRCGHARRVLAALARWARENGAHGACLQVEVGNAAGRALYDAVGMTTGLHRYHYRREPAPCLNQ